MCGEFVWGRENLFRLNTLIFNDNLILRKAGIPYGIRTRVTAVRGRKALAGRRYDVTLTH